MTWRLIMCWPRRALWPRVLVIAQGRELDYILCMPYADPTQQRHAQREWWKSEYQASPTFRRKELRRKKAARAAWTAKRKAQNREYMREFMRAYRAKLKKKEKARGAAAKPAARV